MKFLSEVERSIERAFSGWTERVFGPAESDALIVMHHAILEDVAGRVRTLARGRRVFPFNHVMVRMPEVNEAITARIEQDIREALTGNGCALPAGFAVSFEAGPFAISCEQRATPVAEVAPARLTVVRGAAERNLYTLTKARTNIGRMYELTDDRERVIRRNDVVFGEGGDEDNGTVSRSHAHILRSGADYRICDDGSQYGTRIFRDGRAIDVPPANRRGERLRGGDEIYLGRACLRFEE